MLCILKQDFLGRYSSSGPQDSPEVTSVAAPSSSSALPAATLSREATDFDGKWGMVIIDESHNIRSTLAKTDSMKAETLVEVVKKTPYALLLSGTPSVTSPFNLYRQVDALHPGLLGLNKFAFADEYCELLRGKVPTSLVVASLSLTFFYRGGLTCTRGAGLHQGGGGWWNDALGFKFIYDSCLTLSEGRLHESGTMHTRERVACAAENSGHDPPQKTGRFASAPPHLQGDSSGD
jgi:hypothetical protein